MKLNFKSMLVLAAFLPFFAQAQVNVSLHKDVEVLVVNGDELSLTVMGKRRFNLENGTNQLVVRVSKLIESGADFEKFKTDPLVITFDAENVDLNIEASRNIFAARQIKDFKQNPSFLLISKEGETLVSDQLILPAGPGFMRDHEKEIAKFNQKQGIAIPSIHAELSNIPEVAALGLVAVHQAQPVIAQAAIAQAAIVQDQSVDGALKNETATQVIPRELKKQVSVSSENGLILIKADFLRMDPQEQKIFLHWAVKNVNA